MYEPWKPDFYKGQLVKGELPACNKGINEMEGWSLNVYKEQYKYLELPLGISLKNEKI